VATTTKTAVMVGFFLGIFITLVVFDLIVGSIAKVTTLRGYCRMHFF